MINKAILIGRLTKDPEFRATQRKFYKLAIEKIERELLKETDGN